MYMGDTRIMYHSLSLPHSGQRHTTVYTLSTCHNIYLIQIVTQRIKKKLYRNLIVSITKIAKERNVTFKYDDFIARLDDFRMEAKPMDAVESRR